MKSFDERWSECVRSARKAWAAKPIPEPSWAGIRRRRSAVAGEAAGTESEEWWRWYALRGFGFASLLAVACVAFAVRGPTPGHPLRPGVENAVAEVLWLL